MLKLPVYNQDGTIVEEITLEPTVFDVTPDTHLLEEAVRVHLANRRSSIAATKDRSQVRGGGRKPWKQKGTGRARHGSRRSPLWSGGGVTFGPTPDRNWSLKMNKKTARKALFMALTDKVRSKKLLVVDTLDLPEAKTKMLSKAISDIIATAKTQDRNVLLVLPKKQETIERAGRNIARVSLTNADSLNVYDILNSRSLLVLKEALPVIEKTFSSKE